MNAGIDYGMGLANVDKETRIRYGAISEHSLSDWIYDVISDGAYYGEPTCPKCGNEAIDAAERSEDTDDTEDTDGWEYAKYQCADYACETCKYVFGSESAFSEEMLGWSYEGEGYKLTECLQNDVFVLASPFYTYARFCSPCVPGAGDLDSPIENAGMMHGSPKVYCLGHDWFKDGKAPYRVFKVADDSEVLPEAQG